MQGHFENDAEVMTLQGKCIQQAVDCWADICAACHALYSAVFYDAVRLRAPATHSCIAQQALLQRHLHTDITQLQQIEAFVHV